MKVSWIIILITLGISLIIGFGIYMNPPKKCPNASDMIIYPNAAHQRTYVCSIEGQQLTVVRAQRFNDYDTYLKCSCTK